MRRMMTTRETAATLGVSERRVYSAIKRTGLRWRLQRQHRGGSYLFSGEDVVVLARILKRRNVGYLSRTLTPDACITDASRPR